MGPAERRVGGTPLSPAGALRRSVGDESQPVSEQREVFGAGERNDRVDGRRETGPGRDPGPVEDQQGRHVRNNIFHANAGAGAGVNAARDCGRGCS